MIYAVNYDLKRPGRDYEAFFTAIKGCGPWWHFLGSTWLVDTPLSAGGVWAKLAPHVDQNDFVLVIGVTRDFQGWLPHKAWDWINAHQNQMAA